MKVKGLLVGLVFGVTLSWSGMSSPDVIRDALLFRDGYLFLMFASAVATAWAGQALLRRRRGDLAFPREGVQRRHVMGSLVFGLGWGVANACPGPIATQVGQGAAWGLLTFAGMLAGVWLYLRRGTVETEPAGDAMTPASPVVSPHGAEAVLR